MRWHYSTINLFSVSKCHIQQQCQAKHFLINFIVGDYFVLHFKVLNSFAELNVVEMSKSRIRLLENVNEFNKIVVL